MNQLEVVTIITSEDGNIKDDGKMADMIAP